MASPVIALNELAPRWYDAQFPFHRETIDEFKKIPGATWQPERKRWKIPHHALPVLDAMGIQYRILSRSMRNYATPLAALMPKLRPYQQEDVRRMLCEPQFILGYEQRVGKTPATSVAIASALAYGYIRTAIVLYPNSVRGEWERQLPAFTMGLPFVAVSGTEEFNPAPYENTVCPYLVIGMHYELLRAEGGRDDDGNFEMNKTVREVLNLCYRRGPSLAVADEPHLLVKRKSPRAQLFIKVGAMSAQRWCLTGTPLRSRPRDMFPIWEFLQAGSMGSFSKYTGRYAGGHMGTHGWEDKGKSNEEELKARLHSVWIRRTRREVAPWLPKADRQIILCDMTKAQLAAYRQQEIALAPQILGVFNDDGSPAASAAMRHLADTTSMAKMPRMLARVRHHVEGRAVKALVFALHHETLQKAWATLKDASELKGDPFSAPIFIAGGWMVPDKRRSEIAKWMAHQGPAVLLVNSLSSGIGIDLSDADVAIGLETAWVPADFMQMESRIEDVHLGKRSSPPLLEYLLTRGTIDEDMVSKLITKLNAVEAITGGDAVSADIQDDLRNAGVVDRSILGLAREDPETVANALDSLRSRLSGGEDPELYDRGDNAEADEEYDDEESEEDDDE
jgi:hypothetical protein